MTIHPEAAAAARLASLVDAAAEHVAPDAATMLRALSAIVTEEWSGSAALALTQVVRPLAISTHADTPRGVALYALLNAASDFQQGAFQSDAAAERRENGQDDSYHARAAASLFAKCGLAAAEA